MKPCERENRVGQNKSEILWEKNEGEIISFVDDRANIQLKLQFKSGECEQLMLIARRSSLKHLFYLFLPIIFIGEGLSEEEECYLRDNNIRFSKIIQKCQIYATSEALKNKSVVVCRQNQIQNLEGLISLHPALLDYIEVVFILKVDRLAHKYNITTLNAKVKEVVPSVEKLCDSMSLYESLLFNFRKTVPFYSLKSDYESIIDQRILQHCLMRTCLSTKQGMEMFVEIAQTIFPEEADEIQEFRLSYFEDEGKENILSSYTKQSFAHKLLNSTLRLTSNPCIAIYIARIYNMVYQWVHRQYLCNLAQHSQIISLSNEPDRQDLILFRGSLLDESDLKKLKDNVDEYIQFQGFTSTSKEIDVIKSFEYNAIFQIHVDKGEELQSHPLSAYASTIEISRYPKEQQFLFTPFSIFKIVKIVPFDEKSDKIVLNYCQNDPQMIDKPPQFWNDILNQGDALRMHSDPQMNQLSIAYNEKKITMLQDEKDLSKKIQVFGLLAASHYKLSKFQESLQIYTQIKNKYFSELEALVKIKLLYNICLCLQKCNRVEEAQSLNRESQKMREEEGEKNTRNIFTQEEEEQELKIYEKELEYLRIFMEELDCCLRYKLGKIREGSLVEEYENLTQYWKQIKHNFHKNKCKKLKILVNDKNEPEIIKFLEERHVLMRMRKFTRFRKEGVHIFDTGFTKEMYQIIKEHLFMQKKVQNSLAFKPISFTRGIESEMKPKKRKKDKNLREKEKSRHSDEDKI